jgi:choline dehydrogenase-like flavoprotein
MRTAIVVGSGAGGATVARALQGTFQVTVLEAGRPFSRLELRQPVIERVQRARLLADPRLIRAAFPPMQVRTSGGMVMVNGIGTGGTTTLATGNGVRADGALRALGIDLDPEFAEIGREIRLDTSHQARWHRTTERLFDAFTGTGLDPRPIPKLRTSRAACRHCGRCVLGCPYDAKWDSREYLDEAVAAGARVVTGCRVRRLAFDEGGGVTGVVVLGPLGPRVIEADLVVLAAGGFGTPAILGRSRISCEPRLFVDPVLTVAARWPGAWQVSELPMPFVVQGDHYILSPYFDWLSFLTEPAWRVPAADLVGVMVKLADEPGGTVSGRRIHKRLTALDRRRLDEGAGLATEILRRFGAAPDSIVRGTLNAGHPGGMLPLTAASAATFHDDRLPANVYVADASLFPASLGNPPILTIIAMAKRVARLAATRGEPVPCSRSAG